MQSWKNNLRKSITSKDEIDFTMMSLKERLRLNFLPLLALITLFILNNFVLQPTNSWRTYAYLGFAIFVICYFSVINRENIFEKIGDTWVEESENIWKAVGVVAINSFLTKFAITLLLALEPKLNIRSFELPINTEGSALAYFLSILFIMPIAEQMLFRRGLLDFSDKQSSGITALISVILNSLMWGMHWSIFWENFIISWAWTYLYSINNKNVYVVINAQIALKVTFFLVELFFGNLGNFNNLL